MAKERDLAHGVVAIVVDVGEAVRKSVSHLFGTPVKSVESSALPQADDSEICDHKTAVQHVVDGRKQYNKRHYKRAARCFRRAVIADENYAKAQYYFGLALYQSDHVKGAMGAWVRTIEVDPSSKFAGEARSKIKLIKSHRGRVVDELTHKVKEFNRGESPVPVGRDEHGRGKS